MIAFSLIVAALTIVTPKDGTVVPVKVSAPGARPSSEEVRFVAPPSFRVPEEMARVHSCGTSFVNIPVYDSPLVLTERAALDGRF